MRDCLPGHRSPGDAMGANKSCAAQRGILG